MLGSIQQYDETFYYDLVTWFQDRRMIAPTRYDLPQTGFIIPGVGAGFLITTDTSTAIIDFMVTNPKADPPLRRQAVHRLSKALISKAKSKGFTRVKCDSQLDTIKKKALELGFDDLGAFHVFSKEI